MRKMGEIPNFQSETDAQKFTTEILYIYSGYAIHILYIYLNKK